MTMADAKNLLYIRPPASVALGFGFPVVAQGQARVRCQISAAHTRDDLEFAVGAFKRGGRRLGVLR